MEIIVIPILALLAVTAVTIACMRNLWAAVMFTGIYSFLSASWMLILDAPDVAFTEAAVGAGISTILMLATLSLVPRKNHKSGLIQSSDYETKKRPWKTQIGSAIVAIGTGAMLIYGTLDMPHFGAADAPIQQYPQPSFVEKSQPDMHGLPNVVTAVLASYRGYDTLGETAVIFTAGIAVLLILRRHDDDPEEGTDRVATGETNGKTVGKPGQEAVR